MLQNVNHEQKHGLTDRMPSRLHPALGLKRNGSMFNGAGGRRSIRISHMLCLHAEELAWRTAAYRGLD